MGKLLATDRKPTKVGTKVLRENSIRKKICGVTKKKISLLRRRLSAVLDEKKSWEAKNQELTDSLNKERILISELQKQVFYWKRLYHEATISLNTYKVKHADTIQSVSLRLKDINLALPHLVGLSDTLCRNKLEMKALLNSLKSCETENKFQNAFQDISLENSFPNEKEKRRKHKMRAMVKGVLVQKPTIRQKRGMLNQFQSQDPVNSNLSPIGAHNLTPIIEENEQETKSPLSRRSTRRPQKHHRLGSGDWWRLRKQEKLEKERQIEREQERVHQCSLIVEESSDSDNHFRPVICLQTVSDLLLSPKLMEVETGRPIERNRATNLPSELITRTLREDVNPVEGSSWMNVNSNHYCNKRDPENKIISFPESSDSSDEERDTSNYVKQNVSSILENSLYKNQTFTVCRKTSSSSSPGDINQKASDFSKPEPDSTSNIVFARTSSSRDSLGHSSTNSPVPACKQLVYSENTSGDRRFQYENCGNSRKSSGVVPLVATEKLSPGQDQRRANEFCKNCTPNSSPSEQEKRIRKPNIHLYPDEEYYNPKTVKYKAKKEKPVRKSTNKVPNARLSVGKKSLSLPKKSLEPSRGSTAPSVDLRPSRGLPGCSSQKKTGSKKSSVKKSFEALRQSSTSTDENSSQVSRESNRRSSKRIKGSVSYTESPLSVKRRRPRNM